MDIGLFGTEISPGKLIRDIKGEAPTLMDITLCISPVKSKADILI